MGRTASTGESQTTIFDASLAEASGAAAISPAVPLTVTPAGLASLAGLAKTHEVIAAIANAITNLCPTFIST
jgi:hypothetical protein